jgi:hypothetical protein
MTTTNSTTTRTLNIRSGLKAGAINLNHGVRVSSNLKVDGFIGRNRGLRVRTDLKAGGTKANHSLRVRSGLRGGIILQ